MLLAPGCSQTSVQTEEEAWPLDGGPSRSDRLSVRTSDLLQRSGLQLDARLHHTPVWMLVRSDVAVVQVGL